MNLLALKKCSEDDLHEFVYSNSQYHPNEIYVSLFGSLFGILIFLGISYIYLVSLNIECPYLISIIIKIFIAGDIFFIILSWINKQKYAFMLQNFIVIIIAINWFVFSIVMYPGPLILTYYENKDTLFSIIIYMMIIGFIYLIFVFIKLIILIKKGEMGKGSKGIYDRLFNGKMVYLGFSVPIIVIVGKLARTLTIEMDNRGLNSGPLILMLVFAFIMQIALSSIIPECIILAYCKFRFESFHFSYELYSASGKKRKKLMKQAERENVKKTEENPNDENQKKKKKYIKIKTYKDGIEVEMKIKRNALNFKNILSVKATCKINEWIDHATELKSSIIENGFHPTGPVIYTVENVNKEDNTANIGIYIPLKEEMNLGTNDKYVFIKELKFEDGFTLRHDNTETATYDILRETAGNYNLKLVEPFYNISLDGLRDGVIDVYAPIEENI